MAYNDKSCRGLRLYGKLVLDKLQQKGTTNFEEVSSDVCYCMTTVYLLSRF